MTLFKVELQWWGRVQTVRHYSAPDWELAVRYATDDGHEVFAVRSVDGKILWQRKGDG